MATEIRLARPADANGIAATSRDHIEAGLGWRWTPERVDRCIQDRDINVIVAENDGRPAGFALMRYRDDEAHLLLLAVQPTYRRRGIGTALMAWLEQTVVDTGIGVIWLEVRAMNNSARRFYRRLGFEEIAAVRGYYEGRESAIRMARRLWQRTATSRR
ncbi:MAG: ribosomal protein S18-alanine N-acetyltransferase [Pseudomonadota bacterium]